MSDSSPLPGQTLPYMQFLERAFGSHPRGAMIEIADRCNETCVHCYQVQGMKGEMSRDEIFVLLEDLAKSGVLFVTISGGEATLRPDFLEIVERARELDFVVDIFTNGLRMSQKMARALADLDVRRVEISLYSPRAEVHDWVTQVKGSWEKTVAGIRYLVEAGVYVKVKTPLMSTNVEDRPAYAALAAELGVESMVSPDLKPREDGDRTPERLRMRGDTKRDVMRDIGMLMKPGAPMPAPHGTRKVCGTCEGVHIEANGELRPCTMLDVPLGNARSGGTVFEQLASNPDAQFLKSAKWSDLPECSQCEISGFCGRCHAQSLAEVGDALRPYPTACASALMQWESVTGQTTPLDWKGETVVGPFRTQHGTLERFDPDSTPAQAAERAALYERHQWLRREASAEVSPVAPGQLVQIRRPGKRAREEMVPD